MKTLGGGVNACGRGERAKTDGYANSADGDDCRARALQDREKNSRPT